MKCIKCKGLGHYEEETKPNFFERITCVICEGEGRYNIEATDTRETIKEVKESKKEYVSYDYFNLSLETIHNKIDFIHKRIDYNQKNLSSTVEQIFKTEEYLKYLTKKMEQHLIFMVKKTFAEENIFSLIKDRIQKESFLKNFTKEILEKFVSIMKKDFNKELRITKELSFSINKEIKNALRHLPVSASMEKAALNKINEMVNIEKDKLFIMEKQKLLEKGE